jgi:hypothetical protein
MVSGDRFAIISISGARAREDQSIHEWPEAPRISITGRHYHARKSRSLAAWWGLLAAGLTGGALTAANRQAGEAPDQLRPRLPVARRLSLTWLDHIGRRIGLSAQPRLSAVSRAVTRLEFDFSPCYQGD